MRIIRAGAHLKGRFISGWGSFNRPQTAPEPGAAAEPGLELVGAGGPTELPRQDPNLRPVDCPAVPTSARGKKRRDLARRKSARNSRNAPESHPSNRPRTVAGEGEHHA